MFSRQRGIATRKFFFFGALKGGNTFRANFLYMKLARLELSHLKRVQKLSFSVF